jgi:hypothetical protein
MSPLSDDDSRLLIGFQKLYLTAVTSLWHLMLLLDIFLRDMQIGLHLMRLRRRTGVCDEEGVNRPQALSIFHVSESVRSLFWFLRALDSTGGRAILADAVTAMCGLLPSPRNISVRARRR